MPESPSIILKFLLNTAVNASEHILDVELQLRGKFVKIKVRRQHFRRIFEAVSNVSSLVRLKIVIVAFNCFFEITRVMACDSCEHRASEENVLQRLQLVETQHGVLTSRWWLLSLLGERFGTINFKDVIL